jgi:glutaredoxin
MNILKPLSVIFILSLLVNVVSAANIHKCEDERGEITFQKYCPAGSKLLTEKRYSGTRKTTETKPLPKLVLYVIPGCDVCDQVSKHLADESIDFAQKNIEGNGELQQELKSKTGGVLKVPVLLIGKKAISGYDVTSLNSELTTAGYISKKMKVKRKKKTFQMNS